MAEGAVLDEFERLDTNGDGELSFLELAAALANDAGLSPENSIRHVLYTYLHSDLYCATRHCRRDRWR